MNATIVDLRYRMKEVLRAIDRGETVTVLYRGKEKARLMPVPAASSPVGSSAPASGTNLCLASGKTATILPTLLPGSAICASPARSLHERESNRLRAPENRNDLRHRCAGLGVPGQP